MRLIGHVKSEEQAQTLANYLVSVGIKNQVEPDAEQWAVWIYSEDQIEAGQQALASFAENPSDAKFLNARNKAAVVEAKQRLEEMEFQKRVRTPDQLWSSSRTASVTWTLIIISVIVTLIGMLNLPLPVYDWFAMSEYMGRGLIEVRQGQIWRLLTPIFLHFGWMHILFNMLMMRDLGTLVEVRQGAKTLLWLVVVIGVGSNLGQYFLFGPGFGGMSGVLYGLAGYIWVRGQVDPHSGLFLSPMSVWILLIWFVLCLVNIIPGMANGCHAFGLVMGMVIGAFPWLRGPSRASRT